MGRKVGECRSKMILIMGLLVFAMSFNYGESEFDCSDVQMDMEAACKPFLVGKSNGVTEQCCNVTRALDELGRRSKPRELKKLCRCLESGAVVMGAIADKAKQLPALCKISLPVPIDLKFDCESL